MNRLVPNVDLPADALQGCEDRPIEYPQAIEPHGYLIACENQAMTISYLSANCPTEAGEKPEDLLGRAFATCFPHLSQALRTLQNQGLSTRNGRKFWRLDRDALAEWPVHADSWEVYSTVTPTYTYWELIPETPGAGQAAGDQTELFRSILEDGETQLSDYLARVTSVLRDWLGYERVVVFRFIDNNHGYVEAEAVTAELPPYLGLHFPGRDVPQRARRVLIDLPWRCVPHVAIDPCPLVTREAQPLDLRLAHLRALDSHCRSYRRNMNAAAILFAPLVVDRQLWGFISCFRVQPYWPDATTRSTFDVVARQVANTISNLERRAHEQADADAERVFSELLHANPRFDGLVEQISYQDINLIAVMRADGLALVLNGTIKHLSGNATRAAITALVSQLDENTEVNLVSTPAVSQRFATLPSLLPDVAGMMAIKLSSDRSDYLIWTRREQKSKIIWAGDPTHGLTVLDGKPALSPRESFFSWQQEVQATSLPWTSVDRAFAQRCRVAFADRLAVVRAAEAARLKTEFLVNMSHEIRTPITSLVGFSSLLHDPDLPISQRVQFAEAIQRNSELVLSLINDLLEMAKLEHGSTTVERQLFSVADLCEDVLRIVEFKARDKGLPVRQRIGTDVPATIYSDPLRVKQVLVNLLANAVKFTNSGFVNLIVSIEHAESGGKGHLKFAVEDTGIGVPPEKRDRLFQPFVQVYSSTSGRLGGSGLGLAISSRLARLLGGEVLYEPREGGGSVFSLRLPHEYRPTPAARPSQTAEPATATPDLQREYVLLADDALDNRLLFEHYLTRLKLRFRIVENGQEAVDAVLAQQSKNDPYTLILMDMQMPVMDGTTAVSELRRLGVTTPVIAITAHAFSEERQAAFAAGCDDYMVKPISLTSLGVKVNEMREKKSTD